MNDAEKGEDVFVELSKGDKHMIELITEQRISSVLRRIEIYPFGQKEIFSPVIQIDFVTFDINTGNRIEHDEGLITFNLNFKRASVEDTLTLCEALDYANAIAQRQSPECWYEEMEAFWNKVEFADTLTKSLKSMPGIFAKSEVKA